MSFATDYEFPNVSKYDSDLRELLHEFRKLFNEYSTITADFDNIKLQFEEIQSEFITLRNQINDLLSLVEDDVKKAVEKAVADEMAAVQLILDEMSDRIDGISENVTTFTELVQDVEVGSRSYTDSEVLKLKQELYTKINEIVVDLDNLQWKLPDVYNITRGYKTDLVTCIYDIYDATRDRAFTAESFDLSGITCEEFDKLGFTAYEWDTLGQSILYPENTTRSLVTGEMVPYSTYFEQVIDTFHRENSMTCQDFDDRGLTCEEFDNMLGTAYEWDYNGKSLLAEVTP